MEKINDLILINETEELFKNVESFMLKCLGFSGISISTMTNEEALMFKEGLDLYSDMKNYAKKWAKQQDQQSKMLQEILEKLNEKTDNKN